MARKVENMSYCNVFEESVTVKLYDDRREGIPSVGVNILVFCTVNFYDGMYIPSRVKICDEFHRLRL